MSSLPPVTFASLLRRYRKAAGLTQEELAESARLSKEAIGALERGTRRAPRKETFDLLAEALALTEPERAAFEAAARQQRAANSLAPTPPTTEALPLETMHPPEAGALHPSGPLSTIQVDPPARPSRVLRHGKLVAGLVSLLVLGASLLVGFHVFSGGGTLCLATDLPTSGEYEFNTTLAHAANLAVMQNQHLENGYTLKVINYDDTSQETSESDPQIGAHNVQQIAQNPCMVGMIGPYLSVVAAAEMPIAARAGLVMISPSTTFPGLTLRSYATLDGLNFDLFHPPGKPLNYFRIAPNDVTQGVVAANFTFDNLGARSVYIVHDRNAYGKELAGGFTQGFEIKGGRIVGSEDIPNGNLSVIADVAARIVAANPDAVFYGGGTESGAGLLKAQLFQRGYTGPFVGGDGITGAAVTSAFDFIKQAGANAANGAFATVSAFALPFSSSDAAAQFIQNYSIRYPGEEDLASYTAEAYDATMTLITAIKQLIQAGQPVTRAAMLEQVRHIHYTGVIGPISFDDNGDIVHGVFTIFIVRAGHWVYLQQAST